MTETKVKSPCKTCRNKKKQKPEEIQDPNKHWIKFQVIDTDKNPVEDVVLVVILPNGEYEERITDKNGMVEIRNIEPGKCKLEFDWKGCNINHSLLIQ